MGSTCRLQRSLTCRVVESAERVQGRVLGERGLHWKNEVGGEEGLTILCVSVSVCVCLRLCVCVFMSV